MTKHPKRPRDANQLAKAIVDIATGECKDESRSALVDSAAAELGRRGGLKGGRRRAEKLSPEERRAIARKAAAARWGKDDSGNSDIE